jgi:ATP-dependent DNA helicase PIF1
MHIDLNPKFVEALDYLENTDKHIFITGKAGTGKSTLLKYFRQHTEKNHVVLAPTGVAAVNIYGETIHSFFKFKPGTTPEEARKLGLQARKDKLFEKLQTIIIDEISMVRADLLDCIHNFLAAATHSSAPFGNKQIVMIGDLFQLPPVVTSFEREIFQTVYPSPYFFDAQIMRSIYDNYIDNITYISLDKIYRQSDEDFIDLLNSTRNRTLQQAHFQKLSTLINPEFEATHKDGYVTLVATNKQAEEINARNLEKIKGKRIKLSGTKYGQFEEKEFPTMMNLELAKGARVMFLNNDPDGRWINGTLGEVTGFDEIEDEYSNPISIVKVKIDSGTTVEVWPYTWLKFQTAYNDETKKLESREVGSYVQVPLKLAWAITIHKSQGKTFDKVIIDIGTGAFVSGQIYVALSRCRTLEGIVLKKPITRRDVILDPRINNFVQKYLSSEV